MVRGLVEFKLEAEIEINAMKALLKLEKMEKRPEIIWALKNLDKLIEIASLEDYEEGIHDSRLIGNISLTKGEAKQLIRFLEYMGLVRGNNLTTLGEEALQSGDIYVPEMGIYKVYFIYDAIFGPRIICYDRDEPDTDTKGFLDQLEIYEKFEDKEFDIIARKGSDERKSRIKISFVRKDSDSPTVFMMEGIKGKITINGKGDKIDAMLITKIKDFEIIQKVELVLDKDINLKYWISNWNPEIEAKEVSYDDIKNDIVALENFHKMYPLKDVCIWINGEKYWIYKNNKRDEFCHWSGHVKVSLVPKDESDLFRWLSFLVRKHLKVSKVYPTTEYIENKVNDFLKPIKDKIEKKFGRFRFDNRKFLNDLKRNNDELYWKIMATSDLSIKTLEKI